MTKVNRGATSETETFQSNKIFVFMSSAFVTNTENAGVEESHWVRGADCEAKELFVKPRKYFRDTGNIRRTRSR